MDNWTGTTGTNISGTADLAPLDKQADMIQELLPRCENRRPAVLLGRTELLLPSGGASAGGDGIYLHRVRVADSNDVASVTTSACASSDVIFIPTDNTAASCTEAIPT